MQINGVPNKYEIFQDFYFDVNGVRITYAEALRLFSQMDDDTKGEFEEYYKDETGYEIISPSGYNLESEKCSGNKKSFINIKYTLDAYAKKNGLVLDPQWAVYSAEEIMQMYNNGVVIPQEIVDIANTIVQSKSNVGSTVEGEDDNEDTTEKEPFLDLIPKAEKKIKKCNENSEKIEDKVEKLLPEKQRKQKSVEKKMEDQKASLKEYEDYVREWRSLQNKVNNGETLSRSEAVRYAKLTGILEDKNPKDKGLDKMHIAGELNEINILATLGEKLANETIEIGETLADYTSQTNYKATKNSVSGEIGFLRTIVAMANGKNLAEQAVKIGNETKTYTDETQKSVNEIANIVGVEKMIDKGDEITNEPTVETVQTEGEGDVKGVKNESSADNDVEKDFIVNDKNVGGLIENATEINFDLGKQTVSAVKSIKVAKDHRKFAKIAGEKVTKLVNDFKKREEDRQAKIQQKEEENKKANEELKSLTGKTADELNEEDKTKKDNNQQKGVDKNKVDALKQQVAKNNEEITSLKTETEDEKGEFTNATAREQEIITKAIPEETRALEKDAKYKEEIIPQDKKDLKFTDASGKTLTKIGTYRIELGMMQIMTWNFIEGLKNVAKGTISTGIGLRAQTVSNTSTSDIAEKTTNKAVNQENSAINDLTSLEAQILAVTGAEDTTSQPSNTNSNDDNANSTAGEGDATSQTPQVETQKLATKSLLVSTPQSEGQNAPTQSPVASQDTPKSASAGMLAAYNRERENIKGIVGGEATTNGLGSGKKEEKIDESTDSGPIKDKQKKETDKAKDKLSDIDSATTNDSKDSVKKNKETKKDKKRLQKETKRLQKEMKKDEEQALKLKEESQKAAEKQNEIILEYQALNAENEKIMAEEDAKKLAQPSQLKQNDNDQKGGILASNNFAATGQQSPNIDKLAQNGARIDALGIEFKSYESVITRNSTKIQTIEKSTKTKQKKFNKTTKALNKQIKSEQKAEQEKQKRLAKQLAIVGVQENAYSLTLSIGTIWQVIATGELSNPFTAIKGGVDMTVAQILMAIGTAGIAACAVTKSIINLANGNLSAALVGLGSTAVSIASNFVPGVGGAASKVLTATAQGLSIVSTSAEFVNNVRAIEGKEAKGAFSKIATIAGVASSVTNAASSLGSLGKTTSALGKAAKIASVVGTATTSASQLMSEFNWGDEKLANMLGAIGGGISLAASAVQLAQSFSSNDKVDDKKDDDSKTEGTDKDNTVEQNNTTEKTEESTEDTDTDSDSDKTNKEDKNSKTKENGENNDVQNKYASPKFSKVTDEQLQAEIDKALMQGDREKYTELVFEQANRRIHEKIEVMQADKQAQIAKKQQKAEKIDKIMDIVGQAAGTTANVAGMFMSQSEGEIKKNAATPGRLTKRAQEIIKKNALLRKKRIQALVKSQRYYA